MAETQEVVTKAAVWNWNEIRLWGALGISIISLMWSERNRRVANRSTLAIRTQTIRLEEFRSTVKTPLLEALADCEVAATKAESIARSGQTLDQLKPEIEILNRSTIDALGKLESRLNDANESMFTDDTDWLNGFNELEDEVLGFFNASSNAVNQDSLRRDALLKAKVSLRKLRTKTKARIEAHIKTITTASS
ncbi:hypothetical protein [Hoeflea ulvae]|uniref:Uncharacterized protein n=1 Tax=Hoeflea ulvae TaxID=2983764 RepID=A0ABT3YFH4_9HYPH|nr:hypothetical protein [Hoeflea ulvae]MCY0094593.1 hypothetical protein [Hoeflea ulvae]